MNSLSLIDTKIVTFSDTRLKLVYEIAECIRLVRESKITFHVDVPQSALEWGLAWKVRRKVCTFHAYMPLQTIPAGVSVEGDFNQGPQASTLLCAYMYFVVCLPSAALWVIECRCMREGREVRVWGPAGEPQQGCRN